MKTAPLFAVLVLGISVTGCVTKTYYVAPPPTPTPAPRIIYRDAPAPRKSSVNAPQDNPAGFEAVTRPQSYSN